jgi:DNA-binding MarR family transcriptional regulator
MNDGVRQHIEVWERELPWLDPVKEAIFIRLGILARHTQQLRRDTLAADGVPHWQYKILMKLRRLGPPYAASPSQLADTLGLTRGALSARLAPMEEAGLITRAGDTSDRRRVHVRLTATGSAAFEQLAGREDHGEAALLEALTADERLVLADLLGRLVLAAEERQAQA